MGFSTLSLGTRAIGRRRGVLTLLVALFLLGPVSPGDEPTATEPEPAATPPTPSTRSPLEGVDFARPAQEAFRGWPPASLLERPYWLPWGVRAFQRAALFDRPVLLVMDVRWNLAALKMRFGTLSDPEVLSAVNRDFLSVWVDADLRPDLRERYQVGTWPVVALLMPDGNPMVTGADDLEDLGRPITFRQVGPEGMLTLLGEAAWYYDNFGEQLRKDGQTWMEREGAADPALGEITPQASDALALWMLGNHDREHGGFGLAPKYLVAGLTEYALLREARGEAGLRVLAMDTLDKLVASPLYDRRHGGIHRLSSAPEWGRIEYEKMLDRNANLMRELVVAIQVEDSPTRREALRQTAGFVTSVLARPSGGFWLAQAADFQSDDGGGYWRDPSGQTDAPPVVQTALSGPNALAGATLLRAGALLEDHALLGAGRTALDLVAGAVETGRGVRHAVDSPPSGRRFLESQGAAALWLLDGYEFTGDPEYLARAKDIVDFVRYNLSVAGEARFRDHLPEAVAIGLMAKPRFPVRPNVAMARAMLRLTAHGHDESYRTRARSILSNYADNLAAYGANATLIGVAVEEAIQEPLVITIEGPADAPGSAEFRRIAHGSLEGRWPWRVVATETGSAESGVRLTLGDRTLRADSPVQMRLRLAELTGLSGRKDER